MKTVLAVAAVLGLSASAAFADCAWHNKSAKADVDKSITTASVVAVDKQARLPSDAETIIIEDSGDKPATQ